MCDGEYPYDVLADSVEDHIGKAADQQEAK
jgi:hypothetical protein